MKTSPLVIRPRRPAAFTLVELLAVIAIILILTGLVIATFKFSQDKATRSRTESEIKGMESALEAYKSDNSAYPSPKSVIPTTTVTSGSSTTTEYTYVQSTYNSASLALYQALTGDGDNQISSNGNTSNGTPGRQGKVYMSFKSNQITLTGTTPTALIDPWGNPYGFYAPNTSATPAIPVVKNPTFDLWSSAGSTTAPGNSSDTKWLTNW